MTQPNWTGRMLAVLITAALTASPALADKPEGKGKGKGNEHNEKSEHRQDKSRDDDRGNHAKGSSTSGQGVRFVDQHRGHVRDYYAQEYSRGFCPPGLAKKNNGCMPPGQAKKWQVGRPIPRDVIYYDLPPKLVVQIGTPPTGYRYVRMASDILLIAVGTGMVIDAIQDLGRM
jgi:Ni/Co efflux regulator RcnB